MNARSKAGVFGFFFYGIILITASIHSQEFPASPLPVQSKHLPDTTELSDGKPILTKGKQSDDVYAQRRDEMIEKLKAGRGKSINPAVYEAMRRVPRHCYVPVEYVEEAYGMRWLPNYYGLSITDPFMVAKMTDLLQLTSEDTVLEIGTGSGYHTSINAELAGHVYTIEIVKQLQSLAEKRLTALQYVPGKVTTIQGDGYFGLKEFAPYEKILVTCQTDHIPPALVEQLKPNGIMILPVGPRMQMGKLYMVTKDSEGNIHKKIAGNAKFGPMAGGHFTAKPPTATPETPVSTTPSADQSTPTPLK